MFKVGTPVGRNELMPGDLVFPDTGHVQIYVGGDEVIEAPRTGLNVRQVKIWGFLSGRRVTTPGSSLGDVVTSPQKSVVSNGSVDSLLAIAGLVEQVPGVKEAKFLGKIYTKLSDVELWKRIGVGALGAFLVSAGFGILIRKPAIRVTEAIATDGASEIVRKA
jgi:hypothetical protein